MERIPLNKGIQEETQKILNQIFDAVLGDIILLTAAPTTAGGELKVNQAGIYGNDLYINFFGTVRKYTGTAV